MGDSTRDADADVIVSGREPRRRARRPGRPVRLLVVAQTAALVVAIAVAVHYRAGAGRLDQGRLDRSGAQAAGWPASPMPQVTSAALRLPAGGGVTGTVVITAAALPGAARAQFTVSAGLHGHFAAGTATPFRRGQAPCTASP